MKEFMYEFLPNIPLRKTEILKIWGGCVLSGFDHMVEDRDKSEADYWYLPWFHDQPPPKAMQKGQPESRWIEKRRSKSELSKLDER